jgi:senataxin
MHPEILKWPNQYFYNGALTTDPDLVKHLEALNLKYKPYTVFNLVDSDQNETQTSFNYYNDNEIEFTAQILEKMMIDYRMELGYTYGIITPYIRQKLEFERFFKKKGIKDIFVSSTDAAQGKECDIVIISVARTEGTGFLIHPERLNVALTRAKKFLILCGNFNDLYVSKYFNQQL